eukprot:529224_1
MSAEIFDDYDELNDEFDDIDNTGWDDSDKENQPPLKKQKLSNETNIVTHSNDHNDSNTKINSNSYECIILISGSISKQEINLFLTEVIQNKFKIEGIKQFSMTTDELTHLFFETPNSSINNLNIAEMDLVGEFSKNHIFEFANYAFVIKGSQNNIMSYAKKYSKNVKFYFTLNNLDFNFKFGILFNISMKHNVFWNETIKTNQYHSPQTKHELNNFWEAINLEHKIEKYSQRIRCCCCPVIISQHDEYGAKYRKLIEAFGINQLSQNCYQKAVERHLNIYDGKYIDIKTVMSVLYTYLGYVIDKNKNDKEIPRNFTCICGNTLENLKVGMTDQDRYCEICDCSVPKVVWIQHIGGYKHRKKAENLYRK